MNTALARRMLIAGTGLATAALMGWDQAPQHRAPSGVSAIKAAYGRNIPSKTGVLPAAPPAPAAGTAQRTQAAASEPAVRTVAKVAPRERLAALRAPLSPETAHDPFSVSSWLPPPAPPAPPAPALPPPAPTAPPLPFAYVGALGADVSKEQVFLSNGDRLLIVSLGDVIDGQYRLEAITATGATFTYLPLNVKQVMSTQGEGK
ncbi:hypothetical protein OR16_11648 [Cupriavidus basilensis OR16]|uniref:Prolin-rich transmembrane protein n=1 Tax=Cupriavidus basilensis OR16 TaxID=1127483 RepID=H1S3K3_9BURK|nr:hypothetical protein [Cupriavidus basilensis]EHP42904.1 hypothetical protein OR16_11648 [Cupriavidus basilensis OR16]